jgi:tRNA (mo5U34)-methyltransferase
MTNPAGKTTYSKERLEEMAESVGFWWHSIDLGRGVVTKGHKTPESLARELESLRLPDLKDKTVLDIGAYDGFYSFEAERRRARRVVALDHYVWACDLPKFMEYYRECKERGAVHRPAEETSFWQPDTLPGKRAYDTAHTALNSTVETVIDDFMTMDLRPLGTFDVVFFMGVLYHMENPLASLKRLASVTKSVAIIETHAIVVAGYEGREICEFYSSNQLNADGSNWWGPNLKALEGMCHAAGFSRVEVVKGYEASHRKESPYRNVGNAVGHALKKYSSLFPLPGKRPRYFRAVVHAFK